MVRFLANENFNHNLVRGVLRRRPELDIIRAQDAGLASVDDPGVLAWAAKEGRAVLSHDVNTMPRFAIARIERGEAISGLFIVHQEGAALSTIIEDLLMIAEYSEASDWMNQIRYLPLR